MIPILPRFQRRPPEPDRQKDLGYQILSQLLPLAANVGTAFGQQAMAGSQREEQQKREIEASSRASAERRAHEAALVRQQSQEKAYWENVREGYPGSGPTLDVYEQAYQQALGRRRPQIPVLEDDIGKRPQPSPTPPSDARRDRRPPEAPVRRAPGAGSGDGGGAEPPGPPETSPMRRPPEAEQGVFERAALERGLSGPTAQRFERVMTHPSTPSEPRTLAALLWKQEREISALGPAPQDNLEKWAQWNARKKKLAEKYTQYVAAAIAQGEMDHKAGTLVYQVTTELMKAYRIGSGRHSRPGLLPVDPNWARGFGQGSGKPLQVPEFRTVGRAGGGGVGRGQAPDGELPLEYPMPYGGAREKGTSPGQPYPKMVKLTPSSLRMLIMKSAGHEGHGALNRLWEISAQFNHNWSGPIRAEIQRQANEEGLVANVYRVAADVLGEQKSAKVAPDPKVSGSRAHTVAVQREMERIQDATRERLTESKNPDRGSSVSVSVLDAATHKRLSGMTDAQRAKEIRRMAEQRVGSARAGGTTYAAAQRQGDAEATRWMASRTGTTTVLPGGVRHFRSYLQQQGAWPRLVKVYADTYTESLNATGGDVGRARADAKKAQEAVLRQTLDAYRRVAR